MRPPTSICRPCIASSSRLVAPTHTRHIVSQPPLPVFFTPPFLTPSQPRPPVESSRSANDKGKGKEPAPRRSNEGEVDDREWELRVGRAMMHLRDTLPVFFGPEYNSSSMFPPDIFSHNVVLKLPQPLPIKISSLTAYSMAFSIARNGMLALHSDMRNSLDRMTLSPTPPAATPLIPGKALTLSRKSIASRQKQIRIQISVHGTPRLPPHKESTWQTSSLYTLSPYSGLIMTHEVESIRPLPGEGVAEWMRSRLLGWVKHEDADPAPVACPRAVPVTGELEVVRYLSERQRK
ncbi:hypothetical protein BCR39DRAFT_538069 [Naematelia encephala]|uniref:Uncharacterized protein n=1 Tax=Naematelia encephala TaxID=71784 RepID=A0A1Y2AYS6_9TREE|nr:hypothetical protein BCR39DRAFT_538069 [Naematelia encephala]